VSIAVTNDVRRSIDNGRPAGARAAPAGRHGQRLRRAGMRKAAGRMGVVSRVVEWWCFWVEIGGVVSMSRCIVRRSLTYGAWGHYSCAGGDARQMWGGRI